MLTSRSYLFIFPLFQFCSGCPASHWFRKNIFRKFLWEKKKKIDFFDSILYFLLKCYNSLNGLLANTLRAPVNRTLYFSDKIEDIYIYIYI